MLKNKLQPRQQY